MFAAALVRTADALLCIAVMLAVPLVLAAFISQLLISHNTLPCGCVQPLDQSGFPRVVQLCPLHARYQAEREQIAREHAAPIISQ
jgi:hypothetical protein